MPASESPAGETTASTPRPPKSPFLTGPVTPVAVPLGYRLNLVAVAFAMVLLPLFYLGVVAAAAAGTLLYIAYVWPQLAGVHNWQVNLIVGGGPPIAGIVLVGYMLRSMVPRRRGAHGGIILAYAAAPALHDLVQEIAKAIGAPRPREIRVDLQANASAALRRGAWSLFRRDLVLTVGLPLAAGLDSRQLAGVYLKLARTSSGTSLRALDGGRLSDRVSSARSTTGSRASSTSAARSTASSKRMPRAATT